MIKLLIPFILLSLAALPVNQRRVYGIQTNNYFQIRDTLPSLDSFHDEDIDTIISSYKNQVFTIKLKKGNSYTYKTEILHQHNGDYRSSKVTDISNLLTRIFVRAEKMPVFKGGAAGWDVYFKEFCSSRMSVIRKYAPATIGIQFIVDNNGDVCDVNIIGSRNDELAALAAEAVKNSPPWTPATQNGYLVICYQKQMVKFE